MGDLPNYSDRANGVVYPEERFPLIAHPVLPPSPPPLPPLNPDPATINDESWAAAEETARQILRTIQPTFASDKKRRGIIDYIQELLGCCVGCEVIAYGSVPLKTYLPDGDIDMTALSSPSCEDALICRIFEVLRNEERHEDSKFAVKDVQLISAEVKLVKCVVQGIIVDISCNQFGGLCTLCFLEQVDHLVNQSHLFKSSIILIKAWCYYESRILGATHGLISTYALEVLVLYIFHMFRSSLNGPLSVLYRFLDYFSKFDWDKYCVSLHGPVCKSSLPDMIVDNQDVEEDDVLLNEEFLRNYTDLFPFQSKGIAKQSRPFPQKFMNIVDPLKDNNNLGRSVNKGNFHRIRSAFKFGARKLGWTLMLPIEKIAEEVEDFFTNTMVRHGARKELSLEVPSLSYYPSGSAVSPSSLRSETVGTCGWQSESIDSAFDVGNEAQSTGNSRRSFLSLDAAQTERKNLDQNGQTNSLTCKETGVGISVETNRNNSFSSRHSNHRDGPCNGLVELGQIPARMVSLMCQNRNISCFTRKGDNLNSLAELDGDYDSHVQSLLDGKCYCGRTTFRPGQPFQPSLHSNFRNKNSSDSSSRSGDSWKKNVHPTTDAIEGVPSTSRGTGTYIPKIDHGSWNGKFSVGRGGNQTSEFGPELNRQAANHGFAGVAQKEPNFYSEGRYETFYPYYMQGPVVEHVDSKKFVEHDSDFCVDAERFFAREPDSIHVDSKKSIISPSKPDNVRLNSRKSVIFPSEPDNIRVASKKSVISPSEPSNVRVDYKKSVTSPRKSDNIRIDYKRTVFSTTEPDNIPVDSKNSVISPSQPANVRVECKKSVISASELDKNCADSKISIVVPQSVPDKYHVDSKTSLVVPPSEPDRNNVESKTSSLVVSPSRSDKIPVESKTSVLPPSESGSTRVESKTSVLSPSRFGSIRVESKTPVLPPRGSDSVRVESKSSAIVPSSEPNIVGADTSEKSIVAPPPSQPNDARADSASAAAYVPKESDFPPLPGSTIRKSAPRPTPRNKPEFKEVANAPPGVLLVQEEKKNKQQQQQDGSCSLSGASGSNAEAPAVISSGSAQDGSDGRVAGEKTYFLKDEDFPPLSSKVTSGRCFSA